MLNIRKANINDTKQVLKHYSTVIDQIQNYESNPEWIHGIYPKEEKIIESIETGELYLGIINSKVVSSMVLDHNPNQGFEEINWNVNCDEKSAYYIHLVAVNQNYKNRGIAKEMLRYTFNNAKNNDIKSIRLSLNRKNLAIEKLYTQFEFKYVDAIEVNDKDRGLKFFNVYEKVI